MNETGFAPPPVLPPTPPKRELSLKLLIVAALGVVAAIIIFFLVIGARTNQVVSPGAAPQTTSFALNDGSTVWYELNGGSAHMIPAPAYLPAESLALSTIGKGAVLQSIVESGTNVAYVTVNPAAIIGAAKAKKPIFADAVKNPGWPYGLAFVAAGSAATTTRFTTVGYGPAFTAGGTLVALAPEGVSSYNATTGARHLLIPATDVNATDFALASDASYAVVPNNATHALDVFSLDAGATAASYLGSVTGTARAVAFVGNDRFVVKTGDGAATLYTVSKTGAKSAGSITLTK